MANSNRMGTGVTTGGSQTQPAVNSDQLRSNDVAGVRDALYVALQRAVDAFGGESKFADAIGASLTDTHLRVNRKEDSKLKLQRAFYDFIAHLRQNDRAAMTWLAAVNDIFGCEPPIKKRELSDDDIARGAAEWVRSLPLSMRDAAKADIARALGVRVEDLKL